MFLCSSCSFHACFCFFALSNWVWLFVCFALSSDHSLRPAQSAFSFFSLCLIPLSPLCLSAFSLCLIRTSCSLGCRRFPVLPLIRARLPHSVVSAVLWWVFLPSLVHPVSCLASCVAVCCGVVYRFPVLPLCCCVLRCGPFFLPRLIRARFYWQLDSSGLRHGTRNSLRGFLACARRA